MIVKIKDKKQNENLIKCIVKTYFEAILRKHDSVEPRSLIVRGKTNKTNVDVDVFISFILMVENAFFSMDRVHQSLIDREFFEQKKFDKFLYPSSTLYRLRREAIDQFISFIGIFGQPSKQATL